MVEAYRARIRELNISYATVDAISGLPDGYTAKLMSPKPMKGLGEKAIEGLNGALGIGFAVAVDADQVQRVRGRWTPRKRAIDKKKQAALASRFSIQNEVPTIIEITPDLQAQLERREYMKMIGKRGGQKGGKRRMKTMSARARQRAASHAARMRWAKCRAAGRKFASPVYPGLRLAPFQGHLPLFGESFPARASGNSFAPQCRTISARFVS